MGSPTCISFQPQQTHRSTLRHLSPHSTTRRSNSRYRTHQAYSSLAAPTLTSSASATTTATVARPDLPRSSTTTTSMSRASTLLSKVAFSAPGSRRNSPPSSVLTTPTREKDGMHFCSEKLQVEEGETSPRWEESLRYWYGSEKKRDGYISFPDFDDFSGSPTEQNSENHRS